METEAEKQSRQAALAEEIKQLKEQLDGFEDDILRLEEHCEETTGMIRERERELAILIHRKQ